MKIAKFFAIIFGCLGCALLLGSMGYFLLNRNAPVRILEEPKEAVECSDSFAQALNAGDLQAAAQKIYGQPDLGVSSVPSNPETALVWDAFRSSIVLEYAGNCYAAQDGLARDATITTLDCSSILEKLPERTQALVNQTIASAADLSEIYDEENHFRQELVDQILQEALQQALAQDGQTVTQEVTIRLILRNGSWWVVPDAALLQALSPAA